jgi:hypothetical protein
MKPGLTEKKLYMELKDIKVIDAHEHLAPEKERTKRKVDVVCLFAPPYTGTDLISAGMPQKSATFGWNGWYSSETWDMLADTNIPLKRRWEIISPYLEKIRYGSYARNVYLSVKEFYGFEDINDENYEQISEEMNKANTPGIYYRILREKCKIQTALTQGGRTDYDYNLLIPLMHSDWADIGSKKDIDLKAKELGESVRTLDDYLSLMEERLKRWKVEGVVGIKMVVVSLNPEYDRNKAIKLFNSLMKKPDTVILSSFPLLDPLRSYLLDEMLEMCAKLDLVVAVHTGVLGDFRCLNPTNLIPLLIKHPNTKFDIYHMGIPWVRETGLIGKNFPNAWLNLCWSHIISPKLVISALDEWIDMVPISKIIAFGGDHDTENAECIYGHLIMAKENISKVLGGRIRDGLMTMKDAIAIAEEWFYQVPKKLYKLKT